MFACPLQPNVTDYVTFLYGPVGIPRVQLPTQFGTATDGDIDTLVDDQQQWNGDQWLGFSVLDLTQNVTGSVTESDQISVSFTPTAANAVQAGDSYALVPGVVVMALNLAMRTVNETLNLADPSVYTLAVYNLAADRLINYAPDQKGQTYFRDLRDKLRINEVSLGVISSSGNEASNSSWLNPTQLERLTLDDLQTLKTPWGRKYLGIAQTYGSNIWGLS